MADEERDPTLQEILLKLEKIDGKLEIVDRFRETTDERSSRLSEQIGELRTMLLERERTSRNMEMDFEKIKVLVKELDPMALVKESEKKEKKIIENKVKVEKLENMIAKLGEEVGAFRDVMEKIKSFENLVEMAKDVKKKISDIEDSKRYTDRLAGKVESIFSELNEKILELEEYKGKITKADELTKELVKSTDRLELKLGDVAERTDRLPTVVEFEDKIEGLAASMRFLTKKIRMQELDEVSSDLGRRMKELSTGMPELERVRELAGERRRIMELMMSVDEDYKKELISKESYEEVKRKNEEMLKGIKESIKTDLGHLVSSLEVEVEQELEKFAETMPTEEELEAEIEVPEPLIPAPEEFKAEAPAFEAPPLEIGAEKGEFEKAFERQAEAFPEFKPIPPPAGVEPEPKVVKPELKVEPRVEPVKPRIEPKVEPRIEPKVEARVVKPEPPTPVKVPVAAEQAVKPEAVTVKAEAPTPKPSLALEKLDAASIENKLNVIETERGVVQNLLDGLSAELDYRKREQMEKRYGDRLEKISQTQAELKKLKERAAP
ncbi:MAG: hypothetical protein V3T58_02210 [Candidatus Hydrothermarchaeales archaeon]